MIHILVTGASGQLGQAMSFISQNLQGFHFEFKDSKDLDITQKEHCEKVFGQKKWDYCINFAAYTQVDKAEQQKDQAFLVNAKGVENLAFFCKENDVVLIQISTDFVFDGQKTTPYLISDTPRAINVYGASKLQGELYVQEILQRYYIIRTSWIYGEFGNNFKKTMLRLAQTHSEIKVVDDQVGAPTNAVDLCYFICELIQKKPRFGIYHYTGDWVGSWYEFAKRIFLQAKLDIQVLPVSSIEFNSVAQRPKYSVLKNTRI